MMGADLLFANLALYYIRIQVVVAGIMYNSNLMMMLLNELRFPNSSEPIGSDQFVRKWLNHIEDFTGIHDRRVCILGTIFPSHISTFNIFNSRAHFATWKMKP